MPPKLSMFEQISKSESYASKSDFPEDKADIRQRVLEDFADIRELLESEFADSQKTNEIMLLVGELAMAVGSVADIRHTEILEREEVRIRKVIRTLLERKEE